MDDLEFKTFYETYKKISFALSVGMMYPNPNNEKGRLAAMIIIIGSIMPVGLLTVIDMYRCYLEKDFVNIVRHSTVLGPFLLAFFKMVLMFLKRNRAKQIIDEITSDYLLFNDRNKKYKDVGKAAIRNSQIYSETGWILLVGSCVMTYPIMAVLLTTYNFLFKADPVKYMVHDFHLPNLEPEARFASPCFEFFFIYMCYCVVLYIVSFVGYDGLFGLSINHACLKMDCYCAVLEDAMRSDSREVYWRVVCVIQDQCKMFEFVNWIQDTFNMWLGLIFMATFVQICTSLYHITEDNGFDVMYLIFLGGAVAHIYVPCRYAAKLKEMSVETADRVYSCGWENIHNQVVRKLIIIMIARSQVPTQITAFNMINFDMELFASILQTSYSLFTLMKS